MFGDACQDGTQVPKSNGGRRPLGVPTIRNRVIQMAVVLVINFFKCATKNRFFDTTLRAGT
jgi:retron-type reverse transcriptase